MTEIEEIINISAGNPGVLDIMCQLIQNHPNNIILILTLFKKYNIQSADIWIIYKLCNKNIDDFICYPFDTYNQLLCLK